MQKIYDWRSAFGSNAVQAVVRFWRDGQMLTADERAEAAAFAIGDSSPYLYGRVSFNQDGSVYVSHANTISTRLTDTVRMRSHHRNAITASRAQ